MTLMLGEGLRWQAWNKPGGIPVFPPHADPSGDCLLRRSGLDPMGWDPKFAGGLAHRLDTPTSGQVLSARTPDDLVWLRDAFSAGQLRKVYRFVTAKNVSWDEHTVETPIAHHKRKRAVMIVKRGANTPCRGKWHPAHTVFRRIGEVDNGATLWEAVIKTGVMHQIRAHAAFVGIPLRGDKRYGGGESLETPDAERIPFLIHHVGLSGPDLSPPAAPLPDFWPQVK